MKRTKGPWKDYTFDWIKAQKQGGTGRICLPMADYERAKTCVNGCDAAQITHPEHLAELLNAVEMSDEPRMNAAFNKLVATS